MTEKLAKSKVKNYAFLCALGVSERQQESLGAASPHGRGKEPECHRSPGSDAHFGLAAGRKSRKSKYAGRTEVLKFSLV
jgi:hypothetical protein